MAKQYSISQHASNIYMFFGKFRSVVETFNAVILECHLIIIMVMILPNNAAILILNVSAFPQVLKKS